MLVSGTATFTGGSPLATSGSATFVNSAVSFDPSTVANLVAWWRNDAGLFSDSGGTTPATADGTTVVRRNSLVGTVYAVADASGANLKLNQINGKAALRHAGNTATGWTIHNLSLTSGRAWTAFVMHKCTARSLTCGLFEAGATQGIGITGCGYLNGPLPNADDQELLCIKSTATGVVWRQNGVETDTTAALASGAVTTDLSLFGFADNGAWPFIGDDYEFLWYDRILTAPEIASVEAYALGRVPPYSVRTDEPAVIFVGDSITAGTGATRNVLAWADKSILDARGVDIDRINVGQGGSTAQGWDNGELEAVAFPYYSADRSSNIFVVSLGTNDLTQNSESAANVLGWLTSIGNKIKALGANVTVVFGSVITRDTMSGPQETQRLALNSSLLTAFSTATTVTNYTLAAGGTTYGDALLDFSALTVTRPGDGIHPDNPGHATMAALATAALFPSPFDILTITTNGGKAMLTLSATPASPPANGSSIVVADNTVAAYNTTHVVQSTSGATITTTSSYTSNGSGGLWYAQPTFDPTTVTGLKLGAYSETGTYSDGGTTPVVADAAAIARWADTISGLSHHLNVLGGAGTRPILKLKQINGFPSIRFDGVDDLLQALYTLAAPHTVFLVYRQLSFNDLTHDFVIANGNSVGGILSRNTPATYIGGNTYPNIAANICDNVFSVVTVIHNGASSLLRVNGVQLISGDAGSEDPNGLTVGGYIDGTRTTNIEVAAVLHYAGVISGANLAYLEAGLAAKYGLSI